MNFDENREHVALAFDGSNPAPLKVDPVTGRLLIAINIVAETTSSRTPKIDENRKSVDKVIDSNGDIQSLLVDENGYLLCDVNIE